MNYFDLHCDTAFEMYHKKQPLLSNNLAVSLEGYSGFDKKAQVFAIWSDNNKEAAEAFGDFFEIFENLRREINENPEKAVLCTDIQTLVGDDTRLKIIPSVEGLGIIENDIARLELLREYGVRIVTLGWQGENSVCGAYDTDIGLTDFGFRVIEECEKLGMTVDVSHLSEKGFWDVANIAKKPFIASHSNSASMCSHPRNLSDTQLRTIVQNGGIVGVNLVGKHLSKALEEITPEISENTVCEAVVNHIVNFVEKGSANSVCLGLDLDGTDSLPGLETVDKATKIAQYMEEHGAQSTLINDIFYNNAYNFFVKNF